MTVMKPCHINLLRDGVFNSVYSVKPRITNSPQGALQSVHKDIPDL